MSDNKKYYYLRLKENFFEDDAIVLLESMPDGYIYSNILMKMMLRSLKDEGRLMFNNIIPYSPQALATITRHNVGVVEKALKIFKDLGLIEILDNGAIYMLNIQNLIGKSSSEADRQREYDRRIADEKKSVRNLEKICKNPTPEIEIEKEIEIETKKEIKTKKTDKRFFDSEELNKTFLEYIAMRKKIKAPMTDRAIDLAVTKLKKIAVLPFSEDFNEQVAIEILNNSIMNSWKGLFPLKDKNNNGGNKPSSFEQMWRDA